MNKAQVNKGNIASMSHDGMTTLTVVFASNGATYTYKSVDSEKYNELLQAAQQEGSEEFKKVFNSIKNDPAISYKKID